MLPLVILPLLLLGGFSYFSLKNNTIQQVKSRLNNYWFQHSEQIESYYNTIEATQLLLSKSNLVKRYYGAQSDAEHAQIKRLLIDTFSQYASSYQDFYEIRLLSPSGVEEVRYSTASERNLTKDESSSDYFTQIKNMTDEQGLFLIANPDNEETALLSVTKLYYANVSSDVLPTLAGYLVFTVRPMVIFDVVNRQFADSGVTMITDVRGTILFSAQSYQQGTPMPTQQFNLLKSSVNNDEVVTFEFEGIPMNFRAGQLSNGYILFTGFSEQEVFADRQYLGMVSMVTTIVVMVMVPFLLYFFLKTLVLQPIAELTMAKRAVGKGNLDVRLDVQQADEIGELYSSFNAMVKQLKVYRQREKENKIHLEDKITGRTKALKDANRELESSNRALQEARTTAEQANELKSSFLANMSHEIRTPLTAIIGFTEQSMKSSIEPEERQDYLQRVLRSGQHLLHLINEILDLSKIEADKLELEHKPINLFELMNDVEAINVSLAREKSLHFVIEYEYPLPQVFNGDLIRLRQVLLNLCSNAVKFTKQGDVSLTVSFDAKNEEVTFAVQDSGIGMSEQELERLFQPFVQADSTIARKFGGSGLGLVISQKLTQLMSGRLEVESIKGLGSRFDVIIPAGIANLNMVECKPQSQTQLLEDDQQVNDFSHAKVLVAEDNQDNQYLIELLLSRFGVSFHTVDNGQAAVECAVYENFDLILMDIQMPQMGGCEAVELLRQSCVDCPVIALTANIMKEDIDYYLEIGFDGTLAKPIEQQNFYETISYHLKKGVESGGAIDKLLVGLESDSEIRRLKDGFRDSLTTIVDNFSEYVANNDWQNLQEHAHMIKGSAGSMGFPQLTEQAANIESYVSDGQFDLAKEAANKFIQTCTKYA